MTDESVNYDIQQVQHDIERLQRDLSRLHNDAASPVISSRYEPAVLYDPLHAEEVVAYERITTPDAYENQDWLPTSIPAISMIDKEIAQAELEEAQQALTTAREILKDADIASVLANSNMENINMINTTSRSEKIRNAIAALIAAASTLIAAEAGAMWQEEDEILKQKLTNTFKKNISPDQKLLKELDDNSFCNYVVNQIVNGTDQDILELIDVFVKTRKKNYERKFKYSKKDIVANIEDYIEYIKTNNTLNEIEKQNVKKHFLKIKDSIIVDYDFKASILMKIVETICYYG